jgi:DNA repair exonuclease SbcCD nuclease subunit
MTRGIHTADIHLTPDDPERMDALRTVLERAENNDVDVVTIGGDLFDSDVAAEQLRESLRELFSDRSYPILTIPGNHDADAFRSNLFFGESFTV